MAQTTCPTQDGSISEDPYGSGIVECNRCGCKYHAPCAELWISKGCAKCGVTPLVIRRNPTSPSYQYAAPTGHREHPPGVRTAGEAIRATQVPAPQASDINAQPRTSRGLQLLIGLLLLVCMLVAVLWITSTVDRPRPSIVPLEGKIIQPVASVPPPNWLKKIAGNRTITRDNYPPPANFQITDRCAGEACGYQRPWRALKQVSLYEKWGKRKSQSVYTLSPRETVFAESGVWIARRAGVFEVTTPISIGGIELRSGDLVYSLMYLGENFMRGYFHGYLAEFSLDGPNNQHVLRKLSDYDAVLWVQMKTGTGIVGWTNDAAYPSFDGQSPSGGATPYVLTKETRENEGLWDYELEVFPAGNKASIVIGDVVIPCPDGGVQRVHTGFVVPGGKAEAVDLVADQPKDLLAETFVQPAVASGGMGVPQPKPSVGTLDVLAPAGAEVILDDVGRGTTDERGILLVGNVVAGSHRVLVQKPGYVTGEYEIELEEGENKPVSANLLMMDGYLTVRTDQPGTTIHVADLGRFDRVVSDVRCPPGRYTVTASHPMMKTETRSVVVTAGEHAAVDIQMTPDPDALHPRLTDGERHANGLESGASIGRANQVQALGPNNATATGARAELHFRAGKMAAFTTDAIEALRSEGTVRFTLIHDHAGMPRSGHAVLFKLTGKTVSFASIGKRIDCALPSDIVPFESIESIQVTRTRAGEVFLVLKMPGFSASDKTSEFRFVVVGSHLESRTVHTGGMRGLVQDVQVSPRNASKILDAVAQVIRQAKEGVR
jgi:hypothetical protein